MKHGKSRRAWVAPLAVFAVVVAGVCIALPLRGPLDAAVVETLGEAPIGDKVVLASEESIAPASSDEIPRYENEDYRDHSVLLTVPRDMGKSALTDYLAAGDLNASSFEVVFSDEDTALVEVRYLSDVDPQLACESFARDGDVVISASPNYIMSVDGEVSGELAGTTGQAQGTLQSALAQPQDGADALYSSDYIPWAASAVRAHDAWEKVKCQQSVTVAVLDTGVDYDHPDLANNLILGDYCKNTYEETYGAAAVDDENGHGTHVTGIIAAEAQNGIGMDGISYNANVLPIRVSYGDTGSMYSSDVIEAIAYVTQLKTNPDSPAELKAISIINMSLGGSSFQDAYRTAIANARDAGILVVASSGNNGQAITQYPCGYTGVLGVGAVALTETGYTIADYSNYGPAVDVSAPGSLVYSTYLNGGYTFMSGTSMATPVVSAVAALLFASNPSATEAWVQQTLKDTAVDYGDAGRDDYFGYGMVRADLALGGAGFGVVANGATSDAGISLPEGIAKDAVVGINFVNAVDTAGAAYTWDATAFASDKPVTGWAVAQQGGLYEIYYGGDGYYPQIPARSSYLLSAFSNLKHVDFNGMGTVYVVNLSYLLYYCESLKSVDLGCFDTTNLVSAFVTFGGCSSIKELDLSGFDTRALTDARYMFFGDYNLKTIYASERFITSQITDSSDMFYNCVKLVGGNGTAYSSANTNKAYARIDSPESPGYFTMHSSGGIDLSGATIEPIADVVYTGAAHTPEPAVSLGGTPLTCGVDYLLTYANNTNAGTASVIVDGMGDYTGSVSATFTINKAVYDMSGVSLEDDVVTYDGTPHSLAISGELPAGVSVSYEGNGQTAAGAYTVTASFTGDADNYEAIADMTATLTIDKAVYDMSGITFADDTVTYDGQPHSLSIAGNLPEGVSVSYEGNGQYSAGSHSVTASFSGDAANYEAIPSMTATLTINQAVYDMSGVAFADGSATYDGQPHSLVVTGQLPAGVDVTYEGNGQTLAGTYIVTAKFTGDAVNYEAIADMTATLAINKAVYDMSGIAFADGSATYDGQPHNLAIFGSLPEGVSVTYEGNGQVNAGTYAVSAKFTGDADNYEAIADMSATLTINKADYDMSGVTFAGASVREDGAIHHLIIDCELPEGVSVTYEGNGQSEPGTYVVTAKFTGDTVNHNPIPDMTATLVISAKIVVEAPAPDTTAYVYTGLAQTYQLAIPADALYELAAGSDALTQTAAGIYTIKLSLKNTADYTWSTGSDPEYAFTIAKATYDMSGIMFADDAVTYDGQPHGLAISGELPVGVSVAYEDNGKTNAGTYTVVASFAGDADNYNAIADMTAILTINKAVYDMSAVSFADDAVTYDGQPHGLAITGELPAGVSVAYEDNGKTNAGTYTVVARFTGDADNYNAIDDMTATLTVNKAVYDMSGVSFADASFEWDNKLHSLEITGALPDGVSVGYEGNGQSTPGTYTVIAHFAGDIFNYESIADMTATMTIASKPPTIVPKTAEYIARLYRVILLNDAPTAYQLEHWTGELAGGTSVVDVVKGFLDSKAFSEAGYTDEQKVSILYAAILGQDEPTQEQVAYWAERLAGGYNIHALAEGFARSEAFAAQCELYGLDPAFTPESDPSALVRRLYADVLLQGEPTPYQLDYWADAIYSGTSVVDVIKGFFDSEAYSKAGYTPEQQTRIIYKAVLGQDDPSADQVTYWSDRISAGYSTHKVIEGFADSTAFRQMCATYGLDPSFESEFTSRDYVARLYKDILKNDAPTNYQLTYWSEELESGKSALGVVDGFLVSDAFATAGYTNEEQVRVLYAAMLGNYNPTQAQLSYWTGKLDDGASIHEVSAGFASSQAFAAECRIYGIQG